jgi:prepilin-type N-terminal cleavage/methylation domain-containing protein
MIPHSKFSRTQPSPGSESPRIGAFTLIELLVVIAIIGILAGILFPVFAQAKIAAKKAASISNLKQICLGSLMYTSDYDDGLALFANGDASLVEDGTVRVDTWVWSTQPYIKNLGVLVDPLMGDPHGIFSPGGSSYSYVNQNQYPDYGINYVFLSPWLRDPATGTCSKR